MSLLSLFRRNSRPQRRKSSRLGSYNSRATLRLAKEQARVNLCFLLCFRYKGKSYRATVEIVRTADRVADFCRKTCIKLECCPNLFGPRMVLEHCSENCSVLTKTKYSKWMRHAAGDVVTP